MDSCLFVGSYSQGVEYWIKSDPIYGFDKTQPLYVMALHFKDIL